MFTESSSLAWLYEETFRWGRVAAMEVLARDLRALGLYTARSLSYDGVEYELVEHPLTGLAAGIMAPGFRPDETIPKGIKRSDVIRLLESTQGEKPSCKRDFAVLMLLANYGLRASEVAGLTLDDIDWENSTIRVRCTKPGRIHVWPLSQAVGHAILRYIRDARPTRHGRCLFLTACAPIKPLGRKNLTKLVSDRLAKIGVVSGRRGPHALRHAAAQHLLDHGTSMKVIGDFLGHRHPASTAIYAKVDLKSLREVAALDLEGLA